MNYVESSFDTTLHNSRGSLKVKVFYSYDCQEDVAVVDVTKVMYMGINLIPQMTQEGIDHLHFEAIEHADATIDFYKHHTRHYGGSND